MKLKLIFNVVLSLGLGTLIYLLFRVSTLNIFSWLNIFNIDFSNSLLRKFTLSKANVFPDWFLFSLPDGLWIFSYVNLMLLVWNFKINFQSIIWISIIPLVAIISEVGQSLGMIRGTFDFSDLLFYILGFILPIIFSHKNLKLKYYEKN